MIDPVLAAVEDYWTPRQALLRTLARWDGPATAFELNETVLAMIDRVSLCAVTKALSRLVVDRLVARHGVDFAMLRAHGLTGVSAIGSAFEYVITDHGRAYIAGRITSPIRCLKAQARRDRRRAAGLCINGDSHGAATDGVLCASCRAQHRRSA